MRQVVVLAVGTVSVGVAAALASYLYGIWAEEHEAQVTAQTWVEDHAALVALAGSVQLPAGYQPIDCDSGDDSQCWRTTDRPADAAVAIERALAQADLTGATTDCSALGELPGVSDATCVVSAPFGHDRSVSIDVMRDLDLDTLRAGLDAGEGDRAYTAALTGTSRVSFSIVPLCDVPGSC